MAKMNVNLILTKDYRKNDCLAPKKQTQNKPNPERSEFTLSVIEGKGQNRLPINPATPKNILKAIRP